MLQTNEGGEGRGCFQEVKMPAEPKRRLAFCSYMAAAMKVSPNTRNKKALKVKLKINK